MVNRESHLKVDESGIFICVLHVLQKVQMSSSQLGALEASWTAALQKSLVDEARQTRKELKASLSILSVARAR